ncbi:putative High choriolytic enzyme 1 [Hypsibius exemplaris]|uniref:Metalloendopeptidase n=1 Tax=Hypsibius exemplaris TaxID=2072580 RepID=A0A1W0X7E4_HYPEX|nr:putative High choriolytic enzyme 1 [Hypsibius exemplaris]
MFPLFDWFCVNISVRYVPAVPSETPSLVGTLKLSRNSQSALNLRDDHHFIPCSYSGSRQAGNNESSLVQRMFSDKSRDRWESKWPTPYTWDHCLAAVIIINAICILGLCLGSTLLLDAAALLSANESPKHAGNAATGHLRSATLPRSQRWRNNTIPYVFSGYDATQERTLEGMMANMTNLTGGCIKFVRRTNEVEFLTIAKANGCASSTFRIGLNPNGCFSTPHVHHELMHQIGFDHEQVRSDRDDYIIIMWDNINEAGKSQYEKKQTNNLNLPYDYNSQTHYNPYDFAIDRNKPTMVAKNGAKLGNGDRGMTKLDIQRIRRFYECEPGGFGTPKKTDTMVGGDELIPADNFFRLVSASGAAEMTFTADGKLVVTKAPNNRVVFTLNVPGVRTAIFQPDSNFVVYGDNRKVLFATNTYLQGATKLVLQDDGIFVLKNDSGKIIWSSLNYGTESPPAPVAPTTTKSPTVLQGGCLARVNPGDTCELFIRGYQVYDINRLMQMNPGLQCASDMKVGTLIYIRRDQGCGTSCTPQLC